MLAFLLITVIKGNERTIGDKLLELDNVKNVHMLYGEFDLVVEFLPQKLFKKGVFISSAGLISVLAIISYWVVKRL